MTSWITSQSAIKRQWREICSHFYGVTSTVLLQLTKIFKIIIDQGHPMDLFLKTSVLIAYSAGLQEKRTR